MEVFTYSYVMVCVQIVEDTRCKSKIWDELMPQKWSVQA